MKTPLPRASILAVALAATFGCTLGAPAEGEGEGDVTGEGEGEGEPDGPVDVGPAPNGFNATTPPGFGDAACSTSQFWQLGDRESETMHPGGDCMQCHNVQGRGPHLDIAGTVMGRAHDGTDCRGVPGVTIDILGPDGSVAGSEQTNDAGNFFFTGDITTISPYKVRLTYQGRTREMLTGQTDGNCMSCHTSTGLNSAPGRIFAP